MESDRRELTSTAATTVPSLKGSKASARAWRPSSGAGTLFSKHFANVLRTRPGVFQGLLGAPRRYGRGFQGVSGGAPCHLRTSFRNL